jgi:hypothetical protein
MSLESSLESGILGSILVGFNEVQGLERKERDNIINKRQLRIAKGKKGNDTHGNQPVEKGKTALSKQNLDGSKNWKRNVKVNERQSPVGHQLRTTK